MLPQIINFFSNLSKTVRWSLISIAALIVAILLFISPLLEYLIEKNSKEWVGRQVVMDDLGLNLLTGGLEIEGLKVFEKDDKTVFVSAGLIDINAEILKIISGNYALASVEMDSLYINLAHDNNGYLYEDLIPPDDTTASPPSDEPVKYEVLNIRITNSRFALDNLAFENRTEFHDLNITSDGIQWDRDDVKANIRFGLGKQGTVNADVRYDLKSSVYNVYTQTSGIDLKPITPYFKEVIAIDEFGCLLSCDLRIKGSAENPTDVAMAGYLATNGFFMTGPRKDTLVSVRDFRIDIDTVNLKNNRIDLRSIKVNGSYTRFDMYDSGLNNFTALMAPDSTEGDSTASEMSPSNPFTMIAEYAKAMRDEYEIDSYSIDSILIDESRILFNDYTLHETFTYDISAMKLWSNNFNSKNKRVEIEASALLNGHGHAEALFAFDPSNMMEMDLFYRVSDMHISDISPYSKFYVAHPFSQGDVTLESSTTVRSMILDSDNKLIVRRIKVGSKSGRPALYDMPLKLAVAILKNPKGDIDLDMPVEGDLNDPNYHLGKIIWNVIKNLLIKAVTAPYKLLAGMFGVNEDELRELKFDYMQSALSEKQLKQLDPIVKILDNKKELTVSIRQLTEPAIEEEQVGSLNARRMYWHRINGGGMADSLTVEQLAAVESITIKDSAFVGWVDSLLGPSYHIVPMQEKVVMVCGRDNVRSVVHRMQEGRIRSLQQHLVSQGADTSRIQLYTEDPAKIPPSETRSKFLIEFGAQ